MRVGVLFFVLLFGLILQAQEEPPSEGAKAVALQGANGRTVEFLGIKAASEKGITVQMVADGPLVGITWDKLDLESLKTDQPDIHAAYLAAKNEGKETELNLGSFFDPTKVKKGNPNKKQNGFYETSSGGIKFLAQMPDGKAKGVLLISIGDGNSSVFISRGFRNTGPFGPLQKEFGLAVVGYDAPVRDPEPGKVDDFVFAEKKSGGAFFSALNTFADHSENPGLEKLPIAVYGVGRIGAAFAYNFTQAYPSQIVAAVAANGAFYAHPVSPESAKVPVLFIQGEYNEDPERWNATHKLEEVLEKNRELNPSWIHAVEHRGRDARSRELGFYGRSFLEEMWKERVPESAAKDGIWSLKPLSGKGYSGDLETFEFEAIEDPAEASEEGKTWLPNRSIATMWSDFGKGELVIP